MFEYEIHHRSLVNIYDNHLHLAVSGTITGYNSKKSYLMIDEKLLFPVENVSKIEVVSSSEDEKCPRKTCEIYQFS